MLLIERYENNQYRRWDSDFRSFICSYYKYSRRKSQHGNSPCTASQAASGIVVDTVDGQPDAVIIIEINNDTSAGNVLLNINRVGGSEIITVDDKASGRQIKNYRVPVYISGNGKTAENRGYIWMDSDQIQTTRLTSKDLGFTNLIQNNSTKLGSMVADTSDPVSRSYTPSLTIIHTLSPPAGFLTLLPMQIKLPPALGHCRPFVRLHYNISATIKATNHKDSTITYGMEDLFSPLNSSANGRYFIKIEIGAKNIDSTLETRDIGALAASAFVF